MSVSNTATQNRRSAIGKISQPLFISLTCLLFALAASAQTSFKYASINFPNARETVANGINKLRQQDPDRAILLVTHYQRLLNYVVPDYVHVMMDGRIAESGGKELALELETRGYKWVEDEVRHSA